MDAPLAKDQVPFTGLAFKLQSDATTYAAPDTTDMIGIANLSIKPNDITQQDPRYNGTIHRPGDLLVGTTYDLTFDVPLCGPGGSTPPSAGAFILGRMLRTLGFTENVVSAAIPVAAETLGVGSTVTEAILGTSAAGTADLYKGLAVALPGSGSVTAATLSMIAAYDAAKKATLAELFDSAPTGKYQIPKQLAYTLSGSDAPPIASTVTWQGNLRMEFQGLAPSAATLTLPTAARDGGGDLPRLSLTYSGDLHGYSQENCPALSLATTVPPFKGGKMMVAGKRMGGSSISLDLSPRVGFRPNPNRASGSESAELVETRRSMGLNLNRTTLAYLDILALRGAQSKHPIQALYGYGSGNYIGFMAADARFASPEPQVGGDFYTDQVTAYLDDPSKAVSIVFPYF